VTARHRVFGGTNENVARVCDVAVLAIPNLEELPLLRLEALLVDKVVISPIVPMRKDL
jgi:predicted dinucleotide-binding enzyme